METKELTGYPHLDKPWMKYYDEKLVKMPLPEKTIYENLRDNVQCYLENTAITYNGMTISYRQFLLKIELAAKVLTAFGVKKKDRVLYLMANLPETAFLLYGTNYIGAIADYVDPRPDSLDYNVSAKKILEIIKKEKIRHIISLDQCYLAMIMPIEKELKQMGIDQVLLISPSDSLDSHGRLYYMQEYLRFNGLRATVKKLRYLKHIQKRINAAVAASILNIQLYKDVVDNVDNVCAAFVGYTPRTVAAITHSSGTSGMFPKTIPLTNEGIISYGFQLSRSNTNTNQGDSSLQILPYFSAYGLGIANFGFSKAYNMIPIPEFIPKNMGSLIKKYKPSAIMGTPNWYLSLPSDKKLSKVDLSFIKTIGYGGDGMAVDDELTINSFLEKHNCEEKITKGHGMSEISGGASYAIGEYNVLGSMGIPMIDTIYGVVDPDTKELVRFDEGDKMIEGEFIISSPAIVDEVFDGNLVIKHGKYDDMDFIYSGDIGKMDKNGVLTFLSRKDRAFTRYDGFKVKPYEIENTIKNVDSVRDCIITPYFSDKKKGNLIQANIIMKIKGNNETAVKQLLYQCFEKNINSSTRQIPSRIIIKSSYPITKNGKIDYKKLLETEMDDEEYYIYLDETSISVGNMQIKKLK